ncbi:MAG: DUF1015 domain-containing protein [bacterium]
MAKIIPFRGILYNQKNVGYLHKVATPPYDVITPKKQDEYYKKSPYNIVRLDLGKEIAGDNLKINKYIRANNFINEWLEKDILYRDEIPSFYFHTQTYCLKNNLRKVRSGFIALVKIEDFESGVVLPHEKTFKKVTSDRLELLRHCKTNLSQVFGLYPDKTNKINKLFNTGLGKPEIELKDEEGSIHRLWKITDTRKIRKIQKDIEKKPLFIADGHHRYETALNYRNERRQRDKKFTGEEPYNYVMMYLSNMDDVGLTILPTHRLLKNFSPIMTSELEKYFFVKKYPFRDEKQKTSQLKMLIAKMEKGRLKKHLFGLYLSGENSFLLLTLKDHNHVLEKLEHGKPREWAELDVVVLHYILIHTIFKVKEEDISYLADTEIACDKVDQKEFKAVILLNPTKISQVKKIASLGERMPHKSTYFYPKILTGLVINSLKDY